MRVDGFIHYTADSLHYQCPKCDTVSRPGGVHDGFSRNWFCKSCKKYSCTWDWRFRGVYLKGNDL